MKGYPAPPFLLVSSLWEATASKRPVLPKLEGDLVYDVAIIGGGYTGLSTARNLAAKGLNPVVIEASHVGWGASGRNGGVLNSHGGTIHPLNFAVGLSKGLSASGIDIFEQSPVIGLRKQINSSAQAGRHIDLLAGAPGFEPGDGGTKNRCLTTWLRPIAANSFDVSGLIAMS